MKNLGFWIPFCIGSIALLILAYTQPTLPLKLVPPGKLEVWAVITGALCVWLTVVRSIWNFPISIVSCVLFAFMFDEQHLYGDKFLQFYFIALAVHGWYWWLNGGKDKTELPVTHGNLSDWIIVAVGLVVGTPLLYYWLTHTPSNTPLWDGITTCGSIVAQILLNRKKFENWFIWIAVDIIYVPLYWYKDYRLTSILYAVFLVMCVSGLMDWKRELRKQQALEPSVV